MPQQSIGTTSYLQSLACSYLGRLQMSPLPWRPAHFGWLCHWKGPAIRTGIEHFASRFREGLWYSPTTISDGGAACIWREQGHGGGHTATTHQYLKLSCRGYSILSFYDGSLAGLPNVTFAVQPVLWSCSATYSSAGSFKAYGPSWWHEYSSSSICWWCSPPCTCSYLIIASG